MGRKLRYWVGAAMLWSFLLVVVGGPLVAAAILAGWRITVAVIAIFFAAVAWIAGGIQLMESGDGP